MHEIGYTIADLGRGCFLFYRPDGRQVPEQSDQPSMGGLSVALDDGTAPVAADAIVATWGGERLDLQLLISAMAGNVLVEGGYSLLTTPSRDLPAAVRAAAEWPLEVARRRDLDRSAA